MQSVTGATSASMLYDASGQRVKRTINGTTNWYLASGLEIDAAGAATISLGFADQQVASYRDGEIFTHNADHLGTSTFQKNGSGQGTYARSTPFGTERGPINWAQMASDLGFTGQRNDLGLDLMYYGARYYDPSLAQFSRPDPMAVDGLNRYAYVRNNPLAFSDPTGYAGKVEAGGTLSVIGCNSNGISGCWWGYTGDFNYGGPIGQTKFEVVILAIGEQCGSGCTDSHVTWLLNYDEVDVLAEWNRRSGGSGLSSVRTTPPPSSTACVTCGGLGSLLDKIDETVDKYQGAAEFLWEGVKQVPSVAKEWLADVYESCKWDCLLATGTVMLLGTAIAGLVCYGITVGTAGVGTYVGCGVAFALTGAATSAVKQATSTGEVDPAVVACEAATSGVAGPAGQTAGRLKNVPKGKSIVPC